MYYLCLTQTNFVSHGMLQNIGTEINVASPVNCNLYHPLSVCKKMFNDEIMDIWMHLLLPF